MCGRGDGDLYKDLITLGIFFRGAQNKTYDILLQMRRNLAQSWWTGMSRCGINGNIVCHLKKN